MEPFRIEGGILKESVSGISRGNHWVLLRKHGGEYLIAGERVHDSGYLADRDSLRPAKVGLRASLNPFDPSRTAHTDYYATMPFSIPAAGDSARDTALSPQGAGRKAGNRPYAFRFPLDLRQESQYHPLRAPAGRGQQIYLVKLAADSQALLANPETTTLRAAGVFRLFTDNAEDGLLVYDASAWIGEGP